MKEISQVLLIAVGLAVFLPVSVVIAFQAGPFGFAFVTALFAGALFLVIYSGMSEESGEST